MAEPMTTERVRALAAEIERKLTGKSAAHCSAEEIAQSGAGAALLRHALPIAEQRDALVAEVARLKAECERRSALLDTERQRNVGLQALLNDLRSANADIQGRAMAARREGAEAFQARVVELTEHDELIARLDAALTAMEVEDV